MVKTPQTLRVPYSALVYDRRAARYRGTDGKFKDPRAIRKIIEADIEATKARMESHARRAQRGELSVEAWRDLHAREIKALHLANLAAAKGGFHALTPADFGRAGQVIRGEYAFANAFAEKAALDPEYLASEAFVNRAASYGDAGIVVYENTREAEESAAGFDWEINEINDGATHCHPKGALESCEQQTGKGAVPTGTLVRFGGCACRNKCRCTRRRFKTREAAEAAILSITVTDKRMGFPESLIMNKGEK